MASAVAGKHPGEHADPLRDEGGFMIAVRAEMLQ
jgi:hypothetical protein